MSQNVRTNHSSSVFYADRQKNVSSLRHVCCSNGKFISCCVSPLSPLPKLIEYVYAQTRRAELGLDEVCSLLLFHYDLTSFATIFCRVMKFSLGSNPLNGLDAVILISYNDLSFHFVANFHFCRAQKCSNASWSGFCLSMPAMLGHVSALNMILWWGFKARGQLMWGGWTLSDIMTRRAWHEECDWDLIE